VGDFDGANQAVGRALTLVTGAHVSLAQEPEAVGPEDPAATEAPPGGEDAAAVEPEPEVCVCPETAGAATLVADSADSREASFPVLKLGMRGEAVAGLQERLRAKGFLDGEADGIFGPETQAAVKVAQREYEITPDGVVGASTWRVLLR